MRISHMGQARSSQADPETLQGRSVEVKSPDATTAAAKEEECHDGP